ncbi:MAG: hypothetical protein IPM18_01785 [Phycisphaerales bacterium]|nr:hypothetical protein [Phycisphaerales bacterium]
MPWLPGAIEFYISGAWHIAGVAVGAIGIIVAKHSQMKAARVLRERGAAGFIRTRTGKRGVLDSVCIRPHLGMSAFLLGLAAGNLAALAFDDAIGPEPIVIAVALSAALLIANTRWSIEITRRDGYYVVESRRLLGSCVQRRAVVVGCTVQFKVAEVVDGDAMAVILKVIADDRAPIDLISHDNPFYLWMPPLDDLIRALARTFNDRYGGV